MEEKERYSIMEVEQIVGVPRTKIRHYIDKGLIKVEKDAQSGYYYYSHDDLVRLCQIVYYRESLGFSIEKIEQLLETNDRAFIEKTTGKQLDYLDKKMRVLNQQRNTMLFNRKMTARHYKYRDLFTLVPFDIAYIIPYSSYFTPSNSVYPIMYGCTEFSFDGHTTDCVQQCCLVFEKDLKYVSPDVLEQVKSENERVEAGMCVHTVVLTDKQVDDPSLLDSTIAWAAKHKFRIVGRIFLTFFFPSYIENTQYTYVETYLPIDIPK